MVHLHGSQRKNLRCALKKNTQSSSSGNFLAEKVNLQFVAAAPFLLCTPVPASSDLGNYL